MEIYPRYPHPQVALMKRASYLTLISVSETGKEWRRRKLERVRMGWEVRYETLLRHQIEILWNFYNQRFGAFEAFYFTSFADDSKITSIVGVTNKIRVTRFRPISTVENDAGNILYFVGEPGTTRSIINWSFTLEPEYELTLDRALDATDYPVGTNIDIAYTVRFRTDDMDYETFVKSVSRTGIELLEVFF